MMIEHVPLGRIALLVAHSKRLDEADVPTEFSGKNIIRKGPKSRRIAYILGKPQTATYVI